MQLSNNRKWLRAIHRDLGFLMVGVSLVYAISGFLLNHMDGKDPAFSSEEKTISLQAALSEDNLLNVWNTNSELPRAKKIFRVDDNHLRLMLDGGIAVYNQQTGVADYEKHTKRKFVYWINKLHYNKVAGWNIMADFFAISLVFFALSGLFMVKGKKGIKGRGKWYLLAGLLIPVIYILTS